MENNITTKQMSGFDNRQCYSLSPPWTTAGFWRERVNSVPSTLLPQTYRYTVPTTTVTETPTLFTFQRHTTQTSSARAVGRSVGCLFLRFHR